MHERQLAREYYKRWNAAEDISAKAFKTVDERFGPGAEGTNSAKTYHDVIHTMQVHEYAMLIARRLFQQDKIGKDDLPLISIAASFHDIVQGLGAGLNESESAIEATNAMQESGMFSSTDIQKVTQMILATRVRYIDGIMQQAAGNSILEHIIADADLAHLGLPFEEYAERARALIIELYGPNPTSDQIREFQASSHQLLSSHNYYTLEAADLFPHQTLNADQIMAKGNALFCAFT